MSLYERIVATATTPPASLDPGECCVVIINQDEHQTWSGYGREEGKKMLRDYNYPSHARGFLVYYQGDSFGVVEYDRQWGALVSFVDDSLFDPAPLGPRQRLSPLAAGSS
jgi:hypothetical protein